jgi:hypothetical protein
MSTSVTKGTWEIVVYKQKELLDQLDYWAVDVWENYEFLESDNPSVAKLLWSDDNYDFEKKTLTKDSLETLVAKAAKFIKGQES